MKTKTVVAMAATCLLAFAQERFDLKVRNYFFAGLRGEAAALETGMKMCEEALAADPKNPEALVWHGSGLYFQAGQAFRKGDPQAGMQLYARGMKEMDDATAMAPDSIGVRIPRGASLLGGSRFMPPEMGRPLIERAVSDYEKAYELQADHLDQIGTHSRGELMIGLADGYSRLGDREKAQVWFGRIKADSGLKGTGYEKSADLWIETKSLPPSKAGCIGCHTGK
jgi:tetratricopeptide (TPR) repeat protein